MPERTIHIRKAVNMGPDLVEAIEAYRRRQKPIPSESAAIRRLIQRGLEAEQRPAVRPSRLTVEPPDLAQGIEENLEEWLEIHELEKDEPGGPAPRTRKRAS